MMGLHRDVVVLSVALRWELVVLSVVPLLAMVSAIGYACYFCYRWRDWRPLFFVVVLLAMSIHQTNELLTVYRTGSVETLEGFGEYPETMANLSASIAVVLILRIVSKERTLAGRLREQLERERELKERQKKLEQFAYAASHDLKEPLRMVSSYLSLIDRRHGEELDEEGREYLRFAVDGADRMREMIDALREYSRVEQGGSFEPVDLDAVLEDVRKDFEVKIEETDAEVTVEPLPDVEGDPSQLQQVFGNLLDNAIEYSGEAPPRVRVDAEREGDEWILSVRDEGIGIDPDHTDRVFEVFHQLNPDGNDSGTGIGLALCRQIVERHGGEIWVDAEPGEGSTFSFTLPVPEGEP